MKRTYLRLIVCSTILTVVLSGCADGESNSDARSSVSGTETISSSDLQIQVETDPVNEPGTTTIPALSEPDTQSVRGTTEETEENMQDIEITVNGKTFSAALYDSDTAKAFAEMLPLTLDMSDYSGFEKVGSLGTTLPTENQQTTTQSGDIVLYNGNQIVIFYGSNSWSYTRLGRIDDLSGWEEALGSGDVKVTFQIRQT